MSSSSTDRRWLALALLAAAQFVVVLDASIVNVALPSIGTALDFSQDNLSWVVNAYTLTFGGFLLLGGRLADLLGRRRMFIAGLILFARRLARRRARPERRLADRRARRPGPGRRAALAGRAVDRHRRRSPRAPSATRRSASGARSRAPAAPPASCSAACSPTGWAGSGCCSSTCRSASPPRSSRRACCPRAATKARRALRRRRRGQRHRGPRRCSSTRWSTPTSAGWGSGARRSGCSARRARAARGVRADRAADRHARWCRSRHLPAADAARRRTSSGC